MNIAIGGQRQQAPALDNAEPCVESAEQKAAKGAEGGNVVAACTLKQYVRDMHDLIPLGYNIRWVENLKRMVTKLLHDDGLITVGDGCSGTSIWMKGLEALQHHWKFEYGVQAVKFEQLLASEIEEDKRQFLHDQHNIHILSADVEEFYANKVTDARTGEQAVLPQCAVVWGRLKLQGLEQFEQFSHCGSDPQEGRDQRFYL